MKLRLAFVAAVVVLVFSAAFAGTTAPVEGRGAAVKLARSSNAFGLDLYQRLRRKPGNLVVSPASIMGALILPLGGARGETAVQMRKVLHLEGTADEAMAATGQLFRSLQAPSRPVVFHIANQLFVEKTYTLGPPYLAKIRAAFGSPIEPLDFKKAPEPSRVRINRWVEGRTQRRIQGLIPSGGITPDSRLVLVNAIYFLGDWQSPFETWMTSPEPFHLSATATKNVPMMQQTSDFRVARKDGVTALEMPYKGGAFSMVFLVPDKIGGLAAVESTLDVKKLDALGSAMKSEYLELTLPKFEVNPGASLSLGEDLRTLGMSLAFDRAKADFIGIAAPLNPRERLVLARIFHKAFVRIDEEGTEAAAATIETMTAEPMAIDMGPIPQLKVDRPFLFLIRDNASGLILFLGRVSDPSQP